MSTIVIVALPEENEPVWKFSSEKKPHVTLLYLSGALDTDQEGIINFVRHAANTSLKRFGLSSDRRGTLGEDDADVLFFDSGAGVDQLRAFRAQLLKNDEIAKTYVKTPQFPGWVPHLTMGYPEKPAKELGVDDRHLLSWINFDRIAVWTSEDEGPEFDLREDSDAQPDDIMHYGVKGMRWGVLRPTNSDGLVEGTVAEAIKKGQTPDTAPKKTRGKKSSDHEAVLANLKKDVSELSTQEINDITNRIKAINNFKATTKAQKEAKENMVKKLSKWALTQVVSGAKRKGESYLQELTGDILEDVLPDTPSGKRRKEDRAAKKAREEAAAKKAREEEAAAKKAEESSNTDSSTSSSKSKDTGSDSPSSSKKARKEAMDDLVDLIMDTDGVYKTRDDIRKSLTKKGG